MMHQDNSSTIYANSFQRRPIRDFWTSFVAKLETKYKDATNNEDEGFTDFSEWESWLIEEGEMESSDEESGSMEDDVIEETQSREFFTIGDMTFTAVESEEFTIVNGFTVKRSEVDDVPYYDLLGVIQSAFVRKAEHSNICYSDVLYLTDSSVTRKTQ